jgi:hypothetical protein
MDGGDPLTLSALFGAPPPEDDDAAGILGQEEEAQQLVLLTAAKTGSVAHVRRVRGTGGMGGRSGRLQCCGFIRFACTDLTVFFFFFFFFFFFLLSLGYPRLVQPGVPIAHAVCYYNLYACVRLMLICYRCWPLTVSMPTSGTHGCLRRSCGRAPTATFAVSRPSSRPRAKRRCPSSRATNRVGVDGCALKNAMLTTNARH